MKAVWLHGVRDARVVDTERPGLEPDSAIIRVASCVVCGSDVHQWDGRRPPAKYPIAFGHETAGTVVEVGNEVVHLAPGDRIAWYLLHGSLAEYCAIRPAELAIGKLAEHVSWEEGASLQLLCSVMRGVANGEPGPGKRALVLGCGAVGLSVMQIALAMGCDEVISADLVPFRRRMAEQLGASRTVDPGREGWHAHLQEPGGAFDIVYDCVDEDRSPKGDTLDLALRLLKVHACCVLVGLSSTPRRIDTSTAVYKGLRIIGAHHTSMARVREFMALACQWVADGTIRVKPYVTHRFTMDQIQEALKTAASQADGVLKVAVNLE
jgi:L-iditol 2-dehydrogenase